ncbi:hypothetical protein M2459_001603 [Parabacteroides sp. PF5-5]|uniref:aspartyl protease family protein n=1 Tax=unclassified Parabacteroides TaxID=2649774 RepID=UPI00247449F3|nr:MULTISPECIES: aspartyl protease family protein [unclassified Parabacteroides]MDH6304865.1 hypothetical protein [Parabacteroides sp. PH5-39]MDH6316049.1 hypothetical protein [Parabacteroides sp. PF5-13]MDH6319706.1 hypothetical protein [Parabacteroides sp. PH5-13]MDH6323437.1 hypothetical protein [Parabacteroides sp. PH5-8]MDH6327055.1 hypothetical protein [Parabacteroides sp. PH5-41]
MKRGVSWLLTVLSVFLVGCTAEKAVVSWGNAPIRVGEHLAVGDFMFDTGATYSAVFDDSILLAGSPVSSETVYDINRSRKKQDIYKIRLLEIGDVSVENGSFIYVPRTELPSYMDQFKGIIGMNIINRANWFFDTRANRVEVCPKDYLISIPDDALCLSYRSSNVHPETSLVIEDILFRKVRIDFGSYHTLDLNPSDIVRINELAAEKHIGSEATSSFSLFQDKIPKTLHEYQDVNVGDSFVFTSLKIHENETDTDIRRIGFGFINYFHYFFIDTQNRKIYLFN